MAVVQPLYCWAIPAVRSGYGGGRFRIDAIEPARPDQTIQQGSSLTAVVAAEEDRVVSENGIYGHSRFCNTDFDDKLACLNLSGV
jgi:hypothetical protein